MNIISLADPASMNTRYMLTIGALETVAAKQHILDQALRLAAEHIAADFVERFGPEIATRLNPEAIANMAIAEAGAAVNHTLKQKLPDKIQTIVQREVEVYQRGLLGGLKRLR